MPPVNNKYSLSAAQRLIANQEQAKLDTGCFLAYSNQMWLLCCRTLNDRITALEEQLEEAQNLLCPPKE